MAAPRSDLLLPRKGNGGEGRARRRRRGWGKNTTTPLLSSLGPQGNTKPRVGGRRRRELINKINKQIKQKKCVCVCVCVCVCERVWHIERVFTGGGNAGGIQNREGRRWGGNTGRKGESWMYGAERSGPETSFLPPLPFPKPSPPSHLPLFPPKPELFSATVPQTCSGWGKNADSF